MLIYLKTVMIIYIYYQMNNIKKLKNNIIFKKFFKKMFNYFENSKIYYSFTIFRIIHS